MMSTQSVVLLVHMGSVKMFLNAHGLLLLHLPATSELAGKKATINTTFLALPAPLVD